MLQPAVSLPDVYRGREQTFIKHLILRRYLERVARNVLWKQPDFVFVDGFSGPWAAKTEGYDDTSFGIAMTLLRQVRADLKQTHGLERRVRCVFVEKGKSAFERLSAAVKAVPDIEAVPLHGRFEDRVQEVQRLVGNAFALVSIDPKGWSFDLQRLAPLLRRRPGEVIVNFMYEHVNRFLDDSRPEIRNSYVLPFGDPEWRTRFEKLTAKGMGREEAVVELFRSQLKRVGDFDHVLSARIQRATADRSHFYLFYGTRHEKGLIEFRKVEREAMEAEEVSRIEAKHDRRAARTGQDLLFGATELSAPRSIEELRRPEIARATVWLSAQLARARSAPYEKVMPATLERFAMTEPEFKDVLIALQQAGSIMLTGMGAKQRKPDRGVTICWAT